MSAPPRTFPDHRADEVAVENSPKSKYSGATADQSLNVLTHRRRNRPRAGRRAMPSSVDGRLGIMSWTCPQLEAGS